MAVVHGLVSSVIFNAGHFYILEIKPADGRGKVAKGNFFGLDRLSRGVPITLEGTWVSHDKHGQQLNVSDWDLHVTDTYGIKTFLSTCLHAFDYMTTSHIVDFYGLKTYEALHDPPKVLEDVTAAVPDDLKAALISWDRMWAVKNLSALLKDGGLTSTDIDAAIIKFGTEAPTIVRENPFRLMEIPGFDFMKVDLLAQSLGISTEDPVRLEGAVLYALNKGLTEGHIFLKKSQIGARIQGLNCNPSLLVTDTSDSRYNDVFRSLRTRKALMIEPDGGFYVPEYHEYEKHSASHLVSFIKTASTTTKAVDASVALDEFAKSARFSLSPEQKEVVNKLVANKVLVLTGLPGSGKTTAVKALVKLFELSKMTFTLMAPTGIAAKRLSYVTGYPASTIHRALGYDGIEWKSGPGNRHLADAVIVDEMSMVDQELLYRLLVALRPDTMVVFVGDSAQLPSVGPGNVLSELVSCPDIPNVQLKSIHRQGEGSNIVTVSRQINQGEYPDLEAASKAKGSQFIYKRMTDEHSICNLIVQLAVKLKEKETDTFQILSPMYDGKVGVYALNEGLREKLNPSGPPEWQGKRSRFRVGDRLMVIKNHYKKNVYNGDIGKLLYISKNTLILRIYGIAKDTYDAEVTFTSAEAEEYLRLAYAITVHKSQGSEWDTIILPMVNSQGWMLQRNLLYTAITRAKKKVYLIGDESAIRRAIENNKVVARNTAFADSVSKVFHDETRENSGNISSS